MTTLDQFNPTNVPTVLTPEEQRAVWFLGALIRIRVGGGSTGGRLAILEHAGSRGYSSPLHRHKPMRRRSSFLTATCASKSVAGRSARVRAPPHSCRVSSRMPSWSPVLRPGSSPCTRRSASTSSRSPLDHQRIPRSRRRRRAKCHPTRPRWSPSRPPTASRSSDRRPSRRSRRTSAAQNRSGQQAGSRGRAAFASRSAQ